MNAQPMNAPLKPEHTADPADLARALPILGNGQCPHCRKAMLREFVLLTRVIVLGAAHSTAKCSQCKAWVRVPVVRSVA
jgi:hypothetical protein